MNGERAFEGTLERTLERILDPDVTVTRDRDCRTRDGTVRYAVSREADATERVRERLAAAEVAVEVAFGTRR